MNYEVTYYDDDQRANVTLYTRTEASARKLARQYRGTWRKA